jgi:hypothetical protein
VNNDLNQLWEFEDRGETDEGESDRFTDKERDAGFVTEVKLKKDGIAAFVVYEGGTDFGKKAEHGPVEAG